MTGVFGARRRRSFWGRTGRWPNRRVAARNAPVTTRSPSSSSLERYRIEFVLIRGIRGQKKQPRIPRITRRIEGFNSSVGCGIIMRRYLTGGKKMNRMKVFVPMFLALLLLSVSAFAGQINGDYVETRSADVYTGPCFANAESGLVGDQATLAWRIRNGEWNGVSLDNLSVVAVTRASATLGDPYHNPYPARS